jgi:hypothetical protein|tara:strand:+ start:1424 stop:1756 length:333 start_codon:yes stop_codon:yes gene_type:complete
MRQGKFHRDMEMRQSKFHRDIPNSAKIAEYWMIVFSDMAGWTVMRTGDEGDEIMTFGSREAAEEQAKVEESNYRDAYDHHSPEELEELVPEYKVISNLDKIRYHDEGSQG